MNYDISGGISYDASSSNIDKNIENLATIAKSVKFNKSDLTKRSMLPKDFTKTNFRIDFLTFEAKKPLYIYENLLRKF